MSGYFQGPPSGKYGPYVPTKRDYRNAGAALSMFPATVPLGLTLSLAGAENTSDGVIAVAGTIPFVRWGRAGVHAARSSTKLISQFSTRTIDDAVSWASRPEKLTHLFDPKHNLGPLVNQLGGQQNTLRAVLNAANGRLPASGVFNNIPVNVGGQTIFIRGSVHNGIPKLGTMFIP